MLVLSLLLLGSAQAATLCNTVVRWTGQCTACPGSWYQTCNSGEEDHGQRGCGFLGCETSCRSKQYDHGCGCNAGNGCNENKDCVMSAWGEYSTCSAECGGGEQTRTRTVTAAAIGNGTCDGDLFETQPCNADPCPAVCEHSDWGAWSTCTAECGGGEQSRTRTFRKEGTDCDADWKEPVEDVYCPDGWGWNDNTTKNPMSLEACKTACINEPTCKGIAHGTSAPAPHTNLCVFCSDLRMESVHDAHWVHFYEIVRPGDLSETQPCNADPCVTPAPVPNPTVSPSPPPTASPDSCAADQCFCVSDGGDTCCYNDNNHCEEDSPSKKCEIDECWDKVDCPGNGYWCQGEGPDCILSAWGEFSACSEECGGGEQTRTRTVTAQAKGNGTCDGDLSETRPCNADPCGATPAPVAKAGCDTIKDKKQCKKSADCLYNKKTKVCSERPVPIPCAEVSNPSRKACKKSKKLGLTTKKCKYDKKNTKKCIDKK